MQVHTVAGQEVSVVMTKSHASALDLQEGRTVWLTAASGATMVPTMSQVSA